MPGGDGGRVRLFDEKRTGVNQDIRAEQVFDDIEDARVAREMRCPRQNKIGHGTPLQIGDGVDRSAEPLFETIQSVAADFKFLRAQLWKR